jgi:nucleoside-diphosphate-sugar epimerase
VPRLLEAGHFVICVDNFYTGRRANIDHLDSHLGFELVEHDLTVPLHLDADEIFNLACPASPAHYQQDPIATMKTSVFGAFNVLGLAKRNGSRILQASTSEVYGDPLEHPQRETYLGNVNPTGHVLATMRASAAPRPYSSTTTDSMLPRSKLRASSTRTAHACSRTTDVWYRTSLCRPSAATHHDLRRRRADAFVLLC